MALVNATNDASEAHFDPCARLAFALRRAFPRANGVGYWGAQLMGAVPAAAFLPAVFDDRAHFGATFVHFGALQAVIREAFLTCLPVFVALPTATHHPVVGRTRPFASGDVVPFWRLVARPVSGASMNPARSLGPAPVSGRLSEVWTHLSGPAIGAIAATVSMSVVLRTTDPEEPVAAQGDPSEAPRSVHGVRGPTGRRGAGRGDRPDSTIGGPAFTPYGRSTR
jgi:aquaporin NIP